MKTKPLPPFTGFRPKKGPLAQFIFDHEPEGIREGRKFRRQLVRVLNKASGVRWIEANAADEPRGRARPHSP